jgi:hypothetical protein
MRRPWRASGRSRSNEVASIHILRRAPCPCGSLRPLAGCCLAWEEAFQRLAARLAAFVATDRVRRFRDRAAALFGNGETPAGAARGRSAGEDACFAEWLLQDYVPPGRTGPLLGAFADAASDLEPREAETLFELLLAPARAFEVTAAVQSRAPAVKDLLTGSEALLGPLGFPEGPIRSDVCVGRLFRLGRRMRVGLSLLRFPYACQAELLAYLRTAYRLSHPGRHVSLVDFADGAAHLYHHFYLERGRSAGGRAHRTCRWIPFAPGRVRYRAFEAGRIGAALDRQSGLERVGETARETRYLWVDRIQGLARGTIAVGPDCLAAEAETAEDLAKLSEFLETCLRGFVARVDSEPMPCWCPPDEPDAIPGPSPAGSSFLMRILARWPDLPSAALGDRTPRKASESATGRDEVAQIVLRIERDMARQRRIGRAWADVGPVWDRLNLPRPAPQRGPGEAGRGSSTRGRERCPSGKR